MAKRVYIAIDLKSFYASVECVQRGLDPLNTNLVVADKDRKNGTICLAVSPGLKKFGIPGRPRLFELKNAVRQVNIDRQSKLNGQKLKDKSIYVDELIRKENLSLDYLVAKPQMALYIKVSARIYEVYLKWIAPEDIHVYSIDEVFIDATKYLKLYKMTAHDLAQNIILDVLKTTGITATAGIGTNLYLAKVAMDIWAKKLEEDENGVRIASLTEETYKKYLWSHRPITDFWRVGKGYENRLRKLGLYTMGDIARCSVYNEDILYKAFGINAELLIDHAWGFEPVEIKDIKNYRPKDKSISTSQVLPRAYRHNEAKIVLKEMADVLAMDLGKKGLVTSNIVVSIGYDYKSLLDPNLDYRGDTKVDINGREVPKKSRATKSLLESTRSPSLLIKTCLALYDKCANKDLLIRRLSISANNIVDEKTYLKNQVRQLNFLADDDLEKTQAKFKKEKLVQDAIMDIKNKYGKNAIVKGLNLQEPATGMERNNQIGGHKA